MFKRKIAIHRHGRRLIPITQPSSRFTSFIIPNYPLVAAEQGFIKRCRLSWLTNSAQMRGVGGGGCGASASKHSCAHEAQINFGDLNITFLQYVTTRSYNIQKISSALMKTTWTQQVTSSKKKLIQVHAELQISPLCMYLPVFMTYMYSVTYVRPTSQIIAQYSTTHSHVLFHQIMSALDRSNYNENNLLSSV